MPTMRAGRNTEPRPWCTSAMRMHGHGHPGVGHPILSVDSVTHIELDVMVVGAGQAGLATGFFLRPTGLRFQLYDRATRVGDAWRRRYDALTLFSPRAYSALPGLRMDGDPDGYAGRTEVADYLGRYAESLGLPIALGQHIETMARQDGGFVASSRSGQRVFGRAVIVATGAFQQSVMPSFASRLAAHVTRLTADSYRNPGQVPHGRVLVVGGGATGRQIAHDLASSHDVTLSTSRSPGITPQRIMGRDVMAWFDALGFLRADKGSLKGRFARAHESFPGLHLRSAALRRRGVRLRPRTIGAEGDRCRFADGSVETIDAVIWAIGYQDDSSWLHVDGAVNAGGEFVQDRGHAPVPNLFHVGRSWQTSRASALLCGVANDAERIVRSAAVALGCRP
jgi:putative flavoprotein involved in K+ transport